MNITEGLKGILELAETFDDRIASRLLNARIIEMQGIDRRSDK